ncbi:MAG: hypothetical protein OEZ32_12980 [Nitrospinota bacterium]|nr:hypothetical protein [Nitrospinota bacterium]
MKKQDAAPLAFIAALAAGSAPALAGTTLDEMNMNILMKNTRALQRLAKSSVEAQAIYRRVDGEPPARLKEAYFLGVDVGYSDRRPSLGYCVLRVNDGRVEVVAQAGGLQGYGLATLEDFRNLILPRLLRWRKDAPFKSITLDGPLTPEWNATGSPWYRPQEKLLAARAIPRRVKAQPYNSPVGINLYRAAMDLRYICEKSGYEYEPYSGVRAGREGLVMESFPKLWLAMMLD